MQDRGITAYIDTDQRIHGQSPLSSPRQLSYGFGSQRYGTGP
ncbi:hypothetical protein SPHINGO391_350432 [Sphingomonas aurantiaca]|uniref:Uncharacterized protein n=1 Tax=Sphingomonas aurantiaca TaxID=185949 RepID=A0A5E7YE89_9SPHN|nr:hypothetical protein SPHINGO391_350432 [Sphingomonas aurantiaca]